MQHHAPWRLVMLRCIQRYGLPKKLLRTLRVQMQGFGAPNPNVRNSKDLEVLDGQTLWRLPISPNDMSNQTYYKTETQALC